MTSRDLGRFRPIASAIPVWPVHAADAVSVTVASSAVPPSRNHIAGATVNIVMTATLMQGSAIELETEKKTDPAERNAHERSQPVKRCLIDDIEEIAPQEKTDDDELTAREKHMHRIGRSARHQPSSRSDKR
jgi:hypothetical protein